MAPTQKSSSVRSMTGFSRVSFGGHGLEIDIEVRSVNHRFLDVVTKGPRCYSTFEQDIKSIVQGQHRRGRIEVAVTRRATDIGQDGVEVLPPSIDRYVQMYGAACKRYGVPNDSLGNFIGQVVLRECQSNDDLRAVSEEEGGILIRLISEASEALGVMRETEGAALVGDVSRRVESLIGIHAAISRSSQGAAERIRERLMERVKQLPQEIRIDEQRLATEVALLSERVDIAEELSRLHIHLTRFSELLKGDVEGIGRKLDFMTQEIGREINTIGSKAQDAGIQGFVVEAKAELERIREQVQNIE